MEVVCALSNRATFDRPNLDSLMCDPNPSLKVTLTVGYSLKANISQTVHPIHSMFGSRPGFSGSVDRFEWRYLRFDKNPTWRLTAKMAITSTSQSVCRSIDAMFARVGFSAELRFLP